MIQNINTGIIPNDGTGDNLRNAFIKVNENFQFILDNYPDNVELTSIINGIQLQINQIELDLDNYSLVGHTHIISNIIGLQGALNQLVPYTQYITDINLINQSLINLNQAILQLVEEAPEDGELYGRKDGSWEIVSPGIEEAPIDGLEYVRKNATWVIKSSNTELVTPLETYVGKRLKPTESDVSGFLVDRNVNGRTGYEVFNSNTGNGAVSGFVAGASTGDFFNNLMSIQYFGPGYYQSYLRNKGAVYSTNTLYNIATNNGGFIWRGGPDFNSTVEVFKVNNDKSIQLLPVSQATVASEVGKFIANSLNSNRPSYHNGTEWKEIAYTNEVPTKTSDLVNDGEDGMHPYISLLDLPSNLILFPTTTITDPSGYYQLVNSIDDPLYNDVAVDVPTGEITTTSQLIASLISVPNLISGNPGLFNITTVGNIRRISGSGTAEFYFQVYKRTSSGVETLIGVSNPTLASDNAVYAQFTSTALWDDGVFTDTDKIVIKYYANRIVGGSNPSYEFQFGGVTPIRTLVPIPLAVVPVTGSDFIPLSGTTVDNPVTGDIEILSSGLISGSTSGAVSRFYEEDGSFYWEYSDGGINPTVNLYMALPGLLSDTDFSEINPANKLVYAQRQYVDDAISGIGATNISQTPTPTGIELDSSTQTDAGITLPLADGTNAGLLSPTFWTLLTNFATNVRSTLLTGLSTATATEVLATDTVLQGTGKLQGQMNTKTLSLISDGSVTAITGVNVPTIMYSKQIPANLLNDYNRLIAQIQVTKSSGVGTSTLSYHINATNSLTGATQIAVSSITSTIQFAPLERKFKTDGTTISGYPFMASAATDSQNSSALRGSTSYDTTTAIWFIVAVNPASVAESHLLESLELNARRRKITI